MLLPAWHIRGMGCPGCTPEHAQALGGTETLALPLFPVQPPISFDFRASRQSFPTHTPPSLSSSHGVTRGQICPHARPWHTVTGTRPWRGTSAPAAPPGFSSNPPHWQITKPRQTLSCTLTVLSFTLFIWNCMGRLCNQNSLRQLPLGASRGFCSQQNSLSKPVFPYFNFFPCLGKENTASSPQNYPAAMKLAANLSRTGLPLTAIAVSPCVGSGCEAWLCSAQNPLPPKGATSSSIPGGHTSTLCTALCPL